MENLQRLQLLESWVKTQSSGKPFILSAASSDASSRCYFRATFSDDTLIVMDAPQQHEDCTNFLSIAKTFARSGVNVPEVLAQDLEKGFLLLTDFGDTTYLQAMTESPERANHLYGEAVDALIKIQMASGPGILPDYDEALLSRELNLFPDWYIDKHLKVVLSPEQKADLASVFSQIIKNNLSQPRVFVHRDYHSRNLMDTLPSPGILDFQDAVYGPVTYDLVSLFKDAYICWDEERVLDWLIRYWEKAKKVGLPVSTDFADFYRDFEWMGVQRHIKVLGIFARLFHRDGKDGYLKNMPLVMDYLRKACERYRELGPLLLLLDTLAEDRPDATIGYSF